MRLCIFIEVKAIAIAPKVGAQTMHNYCTDSNSKITILKDTLF